MSLPVTALPFDVLLVICAYASERLPFQQAADLLHRTSIKLSPNDPRITDALNRLNRTSAMYNVSQFSKLSQISFATLSIDPRTRNHRMGDRNKTISKRKSLFFGALSYATCSPSEPTFDQLWTGLQLLIARDELQDADVFCVRSLLGSKAEWGHSLFTNVQAMGVLAVEGLLGAFFSEFMDRLNAIKSILARHQISTVDLSIVPECGGEYSISFAIQPGEHVDLYGALKSSRRETEEFLQTLFGSSSVAGIGWAFKYNGQNVESLYRPENEAPKCNTFAQLAGYARENNGGNSNAVVDSMGAVSGKRTAKLIISKFAEMDIPVTSDSVPQGILVERIQAQVGTAIKRMYHLNSRDNVQLGVVSIDYVKGIAVVAVTMNWSNDGGMMFSDDVNKVGLVRVAIDNGAKTVMKQGHFPPCLQGQ